jgi:SPP1 family predicted phage head-tail adaptor
MSDAIGALKARVTLQSPLRVADEIGGAAIAWSDEGDVWAEIVALGADESAAFDTSSSVSAYRVTINRRDDARVGWRVAWGERLLRIVGVRDEGAARIELSCEEETL